MRAPRATVTLRWVLAAFTCVGALGVLAQVLRRGLDWGTLDKTLYGVGLLLTTVLLIGPEVVGWVLFPIYRLVDHVLLPSESEPPPVDFTLARFYGSQLRYEEACEEYEKIIRYHPEQTTAYLEGIQAATQAGDEELARKFYRAARRIMRTKDKRSLLEIVYTVRHELPAPAAEEAPATEEENPAPADPAA